MCVCLCMCVFLLRQWLNIYTYVTLHFILGHISIDMMTESLLETLQNHKRGKLIDKIYKNFLHEKKTKYASLNHYCHKEILQSKYHCWLQINSRCLTRRKKRSLINLFIEFVFLLMRIHQEFINSSGTL